MSNVSLFWPPTEPGGYATQVTEHPATLRPMAFLERLGAEVTWLSVDDAGRVDPAVVGRAITPRTILITITHANNETGTLQAIDDIGAIAREHAIRFSLGRKTALDEIEAVVDQLSLVVLTRSFTNVAGAHG